MEDRERLNSFGWRENEDLEKEEKIMKEQEEGTFYASQQREVWGRVRVH